FILQHTELHRSINNQAMVRIAGTKTENPLALIHNKWNLISASTILTTFVLALLLFSLLINRQTFGSSAVRRRVEEQQLAYGSAWHGVRVTRELRLVRNPNLKPKTSD
ncbi:hypothetical protein BOX15_Mlig022082g3, partial [Macrostomum lignano]